MYNVTIGQRELLAETHGAAPVFLQSTLEALGTLNSTASILIGQESTYRDLIRIDSPACIRIHKTKRIEMEVVCLYRRPIMPKGTR